MTILARAIVQELPWQHAALIARAYAPYVAILGPTMARWQKKSATGPPLPVSKGPVTPYPKVASARKNILYYLEPRGTALWLRGLVTPARQSNVTSPSC
jgi:hypothetical protein